MDQYTLYHVIWLLFFCILFTYYIFFHSLNEDFESNIEINTITNTKSISFFNINKSLQIPNTKENGFMFNGINSYIKLNELDLSIFSISFLLNMKSIDKEQIILDNENFTLGFKNNFYLIVNGNKLEQNEVKVLPNMYYHIVLTYNTQLKFYVNGFLKEELVDELSFKKLNIGISNNLNNSFYGILGGFKILNNELNRDEICEMYNKCVSKETESKVDSEISSYKDMFREMANLGKQCNFKPRGKTLLACKDRCASKDRKKWGGDKCTEEKCDEICNECTDIDYCRWVQESKENLDFLKKPKPFFIKGYALDTKIKITWVNASQPDIIDYYISITERDRPSLRINFSSKSESGLNEFTIINLKNDVQYEIVLYSRNKFGVGQPSNKLKIIPKKDNEEDNETQMSFDDSMENKVYSVDGEIEPSNNNNMSNNEYKNVLDFIQEQNRSINEYNLDINFK